MRHSTTNKRILSYSLLISSFLFLILIWTLVSIYYNNDLIFPSINQIIQAFFGIFKESTNMKALFLTIMRVIVSVIVCFILGFLILSIYIIWPTSLTFFRPIIQIMRSTPLAIVSIFIFILIGDKIGPYIITILMSLPVVVEGLITSSGQINKEIIDEVKTLKGSTFLKIKSIYLPIIFPYIMMTLVQSLGMSFKVMIMGEYICQTPNSIGNNLYSVKMNIEMDTLIAYGILIVIIVCLLELFIKGIKKHLLRNVLS